MRRPTWTGRRGRWIARAGTAIDTAGVTQFRIYFELDDNDDLSNDYLGYYPGDNADPANRPQLVIIYSGGSGGNTAPSATITAPADGSGFLTTDSISFAGSASDAEDGDLSGSLSWTSDLDGVLGSEASFQASLSAGTHVITAAVVDSGGLPASDTITVTVSEPVNAAPEATITAPADGASFLTTDSISFSGSATDAEDGDISGRPGLDLGPGRFNIGSGDSLSLPR